MSQRHIFGISIPGAAAQVSINTRRSLVGCWCLGGKAVWMASWEEDLVCLCSRKRVTSLRNKGNAVLEQSLTWVWARAFPIFISMSSHRLGGRLVSGSRPKPREAEANTPRVEISRAAGDFDSFAQLAERSFRRVSGSGLRTPFSWGKPTPATARKGGELIQLTAPPLCSFVLRARGPGRDVSGKL